MGSTIRVATVTKSRKLETLSEGASGPMAYMAVSRMPKLVTVSRGTASADGVQNSSLLVVAWALRL
jgi:hypothetical protein